MDDVKKFRADHRHVVETEFDDAQYVGIADFNAQRLRADMAEAERDTLRLNLAEARLLLREIRQDCNHSRLRDGQIDNFLHKSSLVTENPNAAEQRIAELEARSNMTNEELIEIARNAALNSVHRYNYMPCHAFRKRLISGSPITG